MSLLEDTYTLFLRDMLIFKKNLGTNIARSLIFPLVFILLLGAFGSSPKNVPIAVVNYDSGIASVSFINLLQTGNSVEVVSLTTQEQAMNLLAQGTVAAVVVIPSGFSQYTVLPQSVYVYLDNSQPQSTGVANARVDAAAVQFGAKVIGGDPAPKTGAISVVSNYAYGAASNYESFVVGGIVIMVAAFGGIFSTGFTMLSDRELGNLKAFLTTPINKYAILLAKIAYGTVQSAFSAYIGLAIGLLYGATIAAGAVGLIELLWIVLLVGLGFGALSIALAVKMKQLQTYALVAQTLTMPLSFLGGAFVSVSLLPVFLLPIVAIDPLTYAVNSVRDIMIKGSLPISALITNSAILIVFAGVMMALAFWMFRDTSQQI